MKTETWTKTQQHWLHKLDIPIDDMLTSKLNTIEKVNDFRTKFALNYWGKHKNTCVCGKDFSIFHFLTDCQLVYNWLRKLFINPDDLLFAQFNPKKNTHLQMWILKWCAWKAYHTELQNIVVQNGTITFSGLGFYKLVKKYEKLHLIYIILTTYTRKISKLLIEETKSFFFYELTRNFHIKKKDHPINRYL